MAALQRLFDGLARNYPGRVTYTVKLVRSRASATNILVWGAHARNEQGAAGRPIDGGGQAAAMATHGPGVFGIITTPVRGLPSSAADSYVCR